MKGTRHICTFLGHLEFTNKNIKKKKQSTIIHEKKKKIKKIP